MTQRLRDRIAQLKAITPQLHAVTDEASRIVQLVEAFLGDECKLGLRASAKVIVHDDGDGHESFRRLEYDRIDGQFRLIVSEGYRDLRDPSDEETTLSRAAWVNCTRELKLQSIDMIPELLARIGQKVEQTIKDTQEATVRVNELLRDLGIVGKEGRS